MSQLLTDHVSSSCLYAKILSSDQLRSAIIPQGIVCSPYEILGYHATLQIHDPYGRRATFHRRQRIRFLQHGVSAIVDQAWGDGVLLANYRHSAGTIGDTFRADGKRHLVIELDRARAKGEVLAFAVSREGWGMFLQSEGWVETVVDHPVTRIRRTILFPKARPPRKVVLITGSRTEHLHISHRDDGSPMVSVSIPEARPHTSYMVRWVW